jgi:single-strand DNA-binding protein
MSDNDITVIGNLTRDAELRYTSGGRGVASFGLAVNRRYQVNGEWQEEAQFIDVVAWGALGENLAASARKGNRVIVKGRFQIRSWDADDGSKRTKAEIVADDVGASFKWAQMQIEKTSRDRPRADDGYEATSQQSSGQGGGSDYDPEPF